MVVRFTQYIMPYIGSLIRNRGSTDIPGNMVLGRSPATLVLAHRQRLHRRSGMPIPRRIASLRRRSAPLGTAPPGDQACRPARIHGWAEFGRGLGNPLL